MFGIFLCALMASDTLLARRLIQYFGTFHNPDCLWVRRSDFWVLLPEPIDPKQNVAVLARKTYFFQPKIMEDLPTDPRRLVAEAPWSVAEWAVALRCDNPRASVRVRFLG